MSWLEQIAPTIATAVAGPLGGLAYEAVSKLMGNSPEDAKALLDSGKMSAEQITQIKLAEIELQKQEQSLGLDFQKLATADKISARDMETATKSYVPGVLAFLITGGFFGILLSLMYGAVAKTDEIMIMLGSLGTAWTGVVGFYFGSSASSQNKDILLHNSSPVK
jgi:hypothetical protein